MKSIKDMTPEERGCNLPVGFMKQVEEWQKANPDKVKTHAPHFDRNGKMTIEPRRTDFIPID